MPIAATPFFLGVLILFVAIWLCGHPRELCVVVHVLHCTQVSFHRFVDLLPAYMRVRLAAGARSNDPCGCEAGTRSILITGAALGSRALRLGRAQPCERLSWGQLATTPLLLLQQQPSSSSHASPASSTVQYRPGPLYRRGIPPLV